MTGPFTVRKHDDGSGVVRIAVRGEIDSDNSAALSLLIVNAAEQTGVDVLVIDLDGVPILAAAGVRSILEGRAAAAHHGSDYRVINAHGVVAEALTASGVAGLVYPVARLETHPTERRMGVSLGS
jgi:anti-anti-sigma factor